MTTPKADSQKILVVDDEAGIRRGCDRVLRSEGYRVLLAEAAEQGIEILGQDPDIDLALVDLRMPGMSGFDFLQRARAIAPETVFVVITAYATLEAAVEATKRGAYDFIAKPFAPDDLLRIVNRALERVNLIRQRNRLEAERRQRMLELSTEQTRLRTVVDCMTDGVLVCNAEQILVLYNPAALRLLDPAPAGPEPVPVRRAVVSGELIEMIEAASEKKTRLSNELRLARPSGEEWVLANVAPVVEPDGTRLLGTVTVVRDITALKQIERVKAQFVNMVAHELRAPLAAVDGFLSVLQEGYAQDPGKQQEILGRSRRRIRALVELVGDLLEVSRMEAGTVRREVAPQRIAEILEEVAGLMRPLAEQNGISVETRIEEELPSIEADREDLIRLASNLLSNAIKYNKPEGRVEVGAEQEGPFVRLRFADTGIGIGEEGRKRLFSEFFREKRPEARQVTGTGLGLSIVKSIVDFYQGRIEVESEIGKGSVFTVYLPFRHSVALPEGDKS
jgi:signal transduction histidine kinase